MNKLNKRVILLYVLTVLLFLSFCRVRSEPGKVWDVRGKIVDLSLSLIGIPYRFGGFDLDGFDCSGFVFYVYDCFGIKIPRTAKKQGKIKSKVKFRNAKPADVLVFKVKRGWHTGIYVGGDSFVHAPTKRGFIRKEKLNSYWKRRLKKTVRIIDE